MKRRFLLLALAMCCFWFSELRFSVEVLFNAYMQTEKHSSFGGMSPTAGGTVEGGGGHSPQVHPLKKTHQIEENKDWVDQTAPTLNR